MMNAGEEIVFDGRLGEDAADVQRRAPVRALHAAMAKTGGAAIASGLLSAAATKILAMMAGPAAVAWLVTLQQVREAAVVLSTGNGQTALVHAASAYAGRRRREFIRTAGLIFAAATALVAMMLLVAPHWVAEHAGLRAGETRAIRWLALTVVLSSAFVFASALLNGAGRVGDLAVLQITATLAMVAGALPAASAIASVGPSRSAVSRPEVLVWLLSFSAALTLVAALARLLPDRDIWRDWFRGPGEIFSFAAARQFGSWSLALLLSSLAATGALLAVRGRIAASHGLGVTGQFDAAWGISMGYVALVLASLQTYYLPLLARSRSADQRSQQVSRVLTTVTLLAAALISLVAWLKPQLLRWFYSPDFRPAIHYLRWTLLGDYLKVTSWVLSIPILAAAEIKVFLAADLVSCGVFVGAFTVLASRRNAATSAGMAFVLMYAAHMSICAAHLARHHAFVPTRPAAWAWTAGLVMVVASSALSWHQL